MKSQKPQRIFSAEIPWFTPGYKPGDSYAAPNFVDWAMVAFLLLITLGLGLCIGQIMNQWYFGWTANPIQPALPQVFEVHT